MAMIMVIRCGLFMSVIRIHVDDVYFVIVIVDGKIAILRC